MNHAAKNDSDHQTPNRRSSNRSLFLILGIIGGFLCLIVVVCGGAIYLAVRTVLPQWRALTMGDEIQRSELTAHYFMMKISGGGVDPAYASTTKEFQSRQTLQQFRDLVGKNPSLKDYNGDFARDGDFDPDKNTYRGTILSEKGKAMSFTVVTVKDGQSWKVDRFTIP